MQTSRPRTERTETRQPVRDRAAARRETSASDAGNAEVTAMIARRARPAPAVEQPDP
ncbi:hypothetical protein [Streptomyces sp. NPDC057623]|uniref:hypothetical protein n=1 Tax=Streptomyces sp. NPDC057623 TaxID=3346187 RepID=UPI00367554C9